jgi:hypothetical protein
MIKNISFLYMNKIIHSNDVLFSPGDIQGNNPIFFKDGMDLFFLMWLHNLSWKGLAWSP